MPKPMSPEELFALRDAEIQQAQALIDGAEAENREFTDDETEQLTKHRAAAEDLQTRGDRGVKAREEREAITNIREAAIAVPSPSTLPAHAVTTSRPSLLDDPARGWAHAGDYYGAVMRAGSQMGIDKRLLIGAGVTGMSQGTGADGGFAVPPAFSTRIWDGVNNAPNSLLGRTDQYPVTGESLTFMANAETSRADGSRFGGVRGYWLAEADQITSSKPKLRQVKIEPQELAALVYMTDKLLKNNQAALDQYVTRAATEEILFKTGDAIINGDGVGKPLGLLNSGSVIATTRTTSSEFHQADVAIMWARLHANLMPNAVWIINQEVLPQLLQMKTLVTNVAASENVGGFSATLFDAGSFTLMGRPIIVSEFAAALGTAGDVILVDLGTYATGTSGGVDVASSIHLRFDYAETAFRFMFAVDGQSWMNSAITPFKGTATLTNIVTVAA